MARGRLGQVCGHLEALAGDSGSKQGWPGRPGGLSSAEFGYSPGSAHCPQALRFLQFDQLLCRVAGNLAAVHAPDSRPVPPRHLQVMEITETILKLCVVPGSSR